MIRKTFLCWTILGGLAAAATAAPDPGGLDSPEATAWLDTGQSGSFGWYQRVPVGEAIECSVHASWTGDTSNHGWAEILVFRATQDLSEVDLVDRIDEGLPDDIIAKHDHAGYGGLPSAWSWERVSWNEPVGFDTEVVVALKLAGAAGPNWASWDGISLELVIENPDDPDNPILTDVLVNGGFDDGETGWTRWDAGWGHANRGITPEPASLWLLLAGSAVWLRRQ